MYEIGQIKKKIRSSANSGPDLFLCTCTRTCFISGRDEEPLFRGGKISN